MVKPKSKKLSYFTLCSNEFVLFLVALGVGWERSRGETESENPKMDRNEILQTPNQFTKTSL